MSKFYQGTTINCYRKVFEESSTNPVNASLIEISIYDKANGAEVENQGMIQDGVGIYHYNYTITGLTGPYHIKYLIRNGVHNTVAWDSFEAIS